MTNNSHRIYIPNSLPSPSHKNYISDAIYKTDQDIDLKDYNQNIIICNKAVGNQIVYVNNMPQNRIYTIINRLESGELQIYDNDVKVDFINEDNNTKTWYMNEPGRHVKLVRHSATEIVMLDNPRTRPFLNLRQNTSQNINSGSWTDIAFQEVLSSSPGYTRHFTHTSGVITVIHSGNYLVQANSAWETSDAVGSRALAFIINNNKTSSDPFYAKTNYKAVGYDKDSIGISLWLNVGDNIRLVAYQSSGNTLAFGTNVVADMVEFSIRKN